MSNQIKLAILLAAPAFLLHETKESKGFTTEFLCCSITEAAKENGLSDKLADELRDEVGGLINNEGHIQGYLVETYDVLWKDITKAMTQPIRRGLLRKLTAKYEALVKDEKLKPIEDKIHTLKAALRLREYYRNRSPYICDIVRNEVKVNGEDPSLAAMDAITADIHIYIDERFSVEYWLEEKLGRPVTAEEVYEARTKMINDLISRYEAEKASV